MITFSAYVSAKNNLDVVHEPVCFENPFMTVNRSIQLKKIKIYFLDVNRSQKEHSDLVRMFYTLKNGHTYSVESLLLSYNKKSQSYVGGVECDGGWMEYDIKNNVMYLDNIRGVNERGFGFEILDSMVDNEYIETFNNPETGWLNTIISNREKESDILKKVWVYGIKCKEKEEPKLQPIYYTTKSYIKAFPNKKDRNLYFQKFYNPLIEDENDKIEHIKLKKAYRSIAKMVQSEGFYFSWMKIEDIKLFIHDNKKAFIHFSPYIPKGASGYFCGGYKLIEMKGDELTILSFNWKCITVISP
jgi:hypothetical protein